MLHLIPYLGVSFQFLFQYIDDLELFMSCIHEDSTQNVPDFAECNNPAIVDLSKRALWIHVHYVYDGQGIVNHCTGKALKTHSEIRRFYLNLFLWFKMKGQISTQECGKWKQEDCKILLSMSRKGREYKDEYIKYQVNGSLYSVSYNESGSFSSSVEACLQITQKRKTKITHGRKSEKEEEKLWW